MHFWLGFMGDHAGDNAGKEYGPEAWWPLNTHQHKLKISTLTSSANAPQSEMRLRRSKCVDADRSALIKFIILKNHQSVE